MKSSARVVVVGGGVTGCSVLYHLVQKGWDDVVLCERSELTAGSTWHSAGHVILYTLNPTISRLNQYGVELYRQLEQMTGQSAGFHPCGNLRLASHPDRLDEFKRYLSVAETTGVEAKLLSPAEVKALWPLVETDGILAAIFNPLDGHIAPADLTQALAAGARQGGAKIYRQTEVTGFTRRPGGEWCVRTNQGDILCEHVVSCTGNYAKQTLAMVGLEAQSVPVKHEYIVTEALPELVERRRQGLPELPVMRDPEQSFYVRQEGDGLAMGAYEGRGEAVFVDGVPASFGMDLFPDDLDKLLPYLERAIERVPSLETVGIRSVINGPMPYTPDDLPTTGPAFGLRNFWLGEGNPFGITLAGGIGWQLGEWIVEGEPSIDMWACDSRRFGAYASRAYSARKTEEAYERTYLLPKPEEELPAARGLKTTPVHDLLAARGAVFGAVYGWERPNWFAPEGMEAVDECSFGRANYFAQVGVECRRARARVVVGDLSHGAKFLVEGAGATGLLQRVLCTALPAPGEIAAGYALTDGGRLRSAFAVQAMAADSYLLESAAGAERYDLDLLRKAAADDASVRVVNLTGREGCLALFGPASRDLLQSLTEADLGEAAFPAGRGRDLTLGYAPLRALRSDPFGELGWLLQCKVEFLRHLLTNLLEAGTAHDLGLIGARAMNALRLEQATPDWGSELNRDVTPLECGLGSLVDFAREGFRGRNALLRQRERGVERRLVCLEIDGQGDSDPLGSEPLRDAAGAVVGQTTSGGYGHSLGRSLAMAYLRVDAAAEAAPLEVKLMNEWYPARVRPAATGD
jgi:dimethylglycine dehydrogenase